MKRRRLRKNWSRRLATARLSASQGPTISIPRWTVRRALAQAPRKRPPEKTLPAPSVPDLSRWGDQGLYAAWLGHSTVLLKLNGYVILTDPILSKRAGVDLRVCQVGIRRRVAPALTLDSLPRLDLILLSHAHMDHFDIPSLRRLASPWTTVVTAKNTQELLWPRRFREVKELGWGEQTRVDGLTVRAFEVNHWGARYGSDHWRGYNGYVIENGACRLLFAGDTALTHAFASLRSAKPFDLAIMPIGAYNPNIHNHCSPEQAWQMGNEAGAERFLPVHHQTFLLGQEPVTEPIERLHRAAGAGAERIVVNHIGEQVHIQ